MFEIGEAVWHQSVIRSGGGGRSEGYFIASTILIDVPEDSKIMKDEIFGPVVIINTFTNEDEVMKRANDSEYGSYASVFTKNISRALRIAKRLEAGSVGINCTSPTMAMDMPFGGWKGSGSDRDFGKYATKHWTESKAVYIAS